MAAKMYQFVTVAHRLVRLLAAVCALGILGGLAVGVWFLGEQCVCV